MANKLICNSAGSQLGQATPAKSATCNMAMCYMLYAVCYMLYGICNMSQFSDPAQLRKFPG